METIVSRRQASQSHWVSASQAVTVLPYGRQLPSGYDTTRENRVQHLCFLAKSKYCARKQLNPNSSILVALPSCVGRYLFSATNPVTVLEFDTTYKYSDSLLSPY